MGSLHQKVLEVQARKGHANGEIRLLVDIKIKKLQELYKKESDIKSIQARYKSTSYKSFMVSGADKNAPYFQGLLKKCLLDESNIGNFIKSGSEHIQHSSKDFFAVYCGYEGYNDFLENNKTTGIPENPLLVSNTNQSNFLIQGATIINEDFINTVKSCKAFTMPEFYGAKQNNNCQWYGIINDFDVIRNEYGNLKEAVLNSFIEEKDGKVSAIVHGSGGSGKSTVLRRLAIDFYKESFDVVWLEKGKIEEFVQKGLPALQNEIEKDLNRKFLVVIEDWYRMFDDYNKSTLGTKILEETFRMNNIRIVIGDRDNNKQYRNHRNNNFELYLSSQDNKEIIEKIIEKNYDWALASEKLFEKVKNYEFSLFMLLFILASIDQKKIKKNSLDLFEPQQVFHNIIESDLKFIASGCIGLAKALYYLGCIYSKYKLVTISYEVFIKIAEFYNEGNIINPVFSNWKIDTAVTNRLKNYFSVYQGNDEGKQFDYIMFNHDLLVEEGFGKLGFQNWNGLDDRIKFELLELITENDNFISSSTYLDAVTHLEKQLFIDENQKITFLEKQLDRQNDHRLYLSSIAGLSRNGLEYFAKKLIFKKFEFIIFWEIYMQRCTCNDWLVNLLDIKNIEKLNQIAIAYILSAYTDEIDYQNPEIKIFRKEFSKGILKYESSIQKFAVDILNCNFWKTLVYNIVIESLRISDKATAMKFSKNVLQDAEWFNIRSSILMHSLDLLKNTKYSKDLCAKVLTYPDWKNLDDSIIIESLLITKNLQLIIQFSNTILHEPDLNEVNQQLIIKTIELSSNKKLALRIISNYKKYLKNGSYFEDELLMKALSLFKNDKELPQEVNTVIEYYLDIYPDSSHTYKIDINYIWIMGLGFHNHDRWKKEAEFNLLNLQQDNNELLVNLLLSYRKYPNKIELICENILSSWGKYKNDSNAHTKLRLLKSSFSSDYFQIALGHPSLKLQAKATALEILDTVKNDGINIPHLAETALRIVENDIYPQWKI